MSTDNLKHEHEDSESSSVHKNHSICCKTEMSLFALTETSKELKLAHIWFLSGLVNNFACMILNSHVF